MKWAAYADAVFNEATGRWISTAGQDRVHMFAAQKKADRVPARLVVHIIPDLKRREDRAAGQGTLSDVWRFQAFFTTLDPGPRRPEGLRARAPTVLGVHRVGVTSRSTTLRATHMHPTLSRRIAWMLVGSSLVLGACGGERLGTEHAISGDWALTRMGDRSYTHYLTTLGEPPIFSFTSNGQWSGTDGCNDIHGTYELAADGEFAGQVGRTTDVGCDLPPRQTLKTTSVMRAATRAQVESGVLRLFDSGDNVLAEFAPASPQ